MGGLLIVRDITAAEQLRGEAEPPAAPSWRACSSSSPTASWRATPTAGSSRAHRRSGPGPLDWPEHFRLYRRRRPHAADRRRGAAVPRAPGRGRDRRRAGRGPARRRSSAAWSRSPARWPAPTAGTIGAVATVADVTGRRETEDRLRASEERYRSVIESVGDIVFQTDLQGRWAFMNESWSRWTGYPVEDGLGRPASELVHPEDRAGARARVRAADRGRRGLGAAAASLSDLRGRDALGRGAGVAGTRRRRPAARPSPA